MTDKKAQALEALGEMKLAIMDVTLKDTDGMAAVLRLLTPAHKLVTVGQQFFEDGMKEAANAAAALLDDPPKDPGCVVCGLVKSKEPTVRQSFDTDRMNVFYFCNACRPKPQQPPVPAWEDEEVAPSSFSKLSAEAMAKQQEAREFFERVKELLDRITYRSGYKIEVGQDDTYGDRTYFQIVCWRPDTHTGSYSWGYGGKRYLSQHMTDSEIFRQIFGACASYEEHEVREGFKVDGKRVFGPHIDVNALATVADELDVRSEK